MRWAVHVARRGTGELEGDLRERDHVEDLGMDVRTVDRNRS